MYRLAMMTRRDFVNAAVLRARHAHLALVSIDTTNFLNVKAALEDSSRQLASDLCTLRVAQDTSLRYGADQRLAVLVSPEGDMLVWRQWHHEREVAPAEVAEMFKRQVAGQIIDQNPLSTYGVRCSVCGPQGLSAEQRVVSRADALADRCPVCGAAAMFDRERLDRGRDRAFTAERSR
jgi:hypothetical protein